MNRQQICLNCKTKIVDFFIFKRRNEEARQIFKNSQYKSFLLEISGDEINVQQKDNNLSNGSTSMFKNNEIYLTFNESTCDDDNNDMNEIFNDGEPDEILPELLFLKTPLDSHEEIPQKINKKMHPENSDRKRRKLAKNMGKSYISANGKIIEDKKMKPNCGEKCRMQCTTRINETTRQKNFDEFYNLADLELQRKFIVDHIQIFEPKHTKVSNKSRSIQRLFFLNGENQGEMVQVCKSIFLNTLVISSQTLDTIQFKAARYGSMADFRGRYPRKKE